MLETIKNGILTIVDFFVTVFDFVVGFIKDTVDFITKLPTAITQVTDQISKFLPTEIISILGAVLAVVIILRVCGRD